MIARLIARGSACMLLLVLQLSSEAFAQAQQSSPALASTTTVELVAAILDSIASSLPEFSEAQTHVGWLRRSIPKGPGRVIPREMVTGLEGIDSALKRSRDLPQAESVRLLEVVREDLFVKASYCRSHPDGMAAVVPLSVRTWAEHGSSRTSTGDSGAEM